MIFKAGRYYVGDPCYIIPDDLWSEFCDKVSAFDGCLGTDEMIEGGFGFEFHGEQVWCANTKYGDGGYYDQHNREYDVATGLIGVVPDSFVVPEPGDKATETSGTMVDGGHIIVFKNDFSVERDDGVIHIGHIAIDTDPPSEEDDAEDDCWDDDEDDDDD